MATIKIGTCGYSRYYVPPGNWKDRYKSKLQAYSEIFEVCEINRTFYKLPQVGTLERWRREVIDDFEFTLKAWQAVTHPASSPTWRRRKEELTKRQQRGFGLFRPSKEVTDAWKETRKRAKALAARVVVFQCPGTFDCTETNEKNMRDFFNRIEQENLVFAWEPRGNWRENPKKIRALCGGLGLVHVVDLLRRQPLSEHQTAYVRLHGLNQNEYDYNYDYSDRELEELAEKVADLCYRSERIYCMFNNYEMYSNAQRLVEIMRS